MRASIVSMLFAVSTAWAAPVPKELKKGDLDARVVKKPKEVYQWLLLPAFLFLVLEACLGERRRTVSP